jgi:hypothetical protein
VKIRHAAALVLVGWYLMMPPFYRVSGLIFKSRVRLEPDEASKFMEDPFNPFQTLEVYSQAPIGDWSIESSYDLADTCEAAKIKDQGDSGWPEKREDIYLRLQSLRQHESKCVASDDPRLKGQ